MASTPDGVCSSRPQSSPPRHMPAWPGSRAHRRVVNGVDALVPTTEVAARRAGELQARAGTSDAVDAIVAAEALLSLRR